MANAEVTMSVGDLVVVKSADDMECPGDGPKTQVILQLQPIPQGMCEEAAETGAATVALETHQGENLNEEEEVELGYPITCGESKGVLLFKKFVCPGINVRCVKYHDQLISPKQFVHLSGKAALKDWKRAIRVGGIMIRKMMDSGQLDFYQHDTVCTNTCRSTKFDLLISNTRCPLQGMESPTHSSPQGNDGQACVIEERPGEGPALTEWNAGTVTVVTEAEAKVEAESISEETLNFWKGIADVGLMGEVVTGVRSQLLDTLQGLLQRSAKAQLHETDMAMLSTLAQVFGLLDTAKRTLKKRRQQTDPSQEQVYTALTGLELQLEEQKKQARDWLTRSQAFQSTSLKSVATVSKSHSKRPKLQRPASACVLSATPSPLTLLSPVVSLGQPFTMAGLPLAQSPGTLTLHPATGLRLVGTAAVQDPSQLGALMGPVELVHLATDGEVGDMEKLGHRARSVVGGTVLAQERTAEEGEDEGQTHTTVIEIDPAPGDHGSGAVELRLEGPPGSDDGTAVVVQGQMEVVGAVEDGSGVLVHGEMVQMEEVEGGASLVLHGGMEEVGALQVEQQGQLHSVQIVVIEDEGRDERDVK